MKKIKILTAAVCLIFGTAAFLSAQGLEDFSIQLKPGVEFPIGPKSALFNEDALYKLSASGAVKLQYIFPKVPLLYMDGGLTYGLHRTQADILSTISAGVGTGVNFRMGNFMSLFTGVELGWYLGVLPTGTTGSNPYAGGSVNLQWDFTPNFSLLFGGGYKYFLGYDEENAKYTDLYQGAHATIGTVFRLTRGSTRTKLNVDNINFDPVFPVFYGYYDNNPVGTVTLKNGENSTISDVNVYFFVNQYMEQPKLSAVLPSLKRGETAEVELNALFTNSVMQLTESTKVSAEIITEYTYLGKRFTSKTPQTVRILDRNSMTWDDDRKAASFVTAKDPTVLLFSKNTAGVIRERGNNPINVNLRIGMGIFETLRLYGMAYVIDPQSAYADASQNAQFIDYLQFPAQSLTFRAGDCDDLSILYSSLLESVGIETAFITIPGHIFMAFSLGIDKNAARKEFTNLENFIFIDDITWVPVEVTLVPEGFLKAWRIGAKQWREATSAGKEGFFPIHDAWNSYDPVAMPGNALALVYPATERILERYEQNLEEFINVEIQPKVNYYNEQLSKSGDTAKVRNRFGILYARYGLYDRAEDQFKLAASRDTGYTAPLVNLGNIYFLREDMENALAFYSRARQIEPLNGKILAGLARVHFELEKYDEVRENYKKLKDMDPELAGQYAYLVNEAGTVGRAAAAKDKGKTMWEDEEE